MTYKHENHSFSKRKNMSWVVCDNCGLVYLNNSFTAWSVRMGCNANDHPDYERIKKKSHEEWLAKQKG